MSKIFTLEEVSALELSAAEAMRDQIIGILNEIKGPEEACCNDCQPYANENRHYLDAVIDIINFRTK